MTVSNFSNHNNNFPVARQEIEISENTMQVLKETLYPGAKDESIMMVLNYCKARRIDPLLKPVHLVPMSVKTGKKDSSGKDEYKFRDVVMPGIGLYRIDASRSGQYAGMTEPEFGEDITEVLGGTKITYPRWCKVTVKKLLNGNIVEFSAKEYWKENYATKSRNDATPNAMWEKRAYGQLAKCAEAQALRKAFPDVVGQEYTKEEMEGKHFDHNDLKGRTFEGKTVNEASISIETMLNTLSRLKKSETLQKQFKIYYKILSKDNDQENLAKLIAHKDKIKNEIESMEDENSSAESQATETTVNHETGEVAK